MGVLLTQYSSPINMSMSVDAFAINLSLGTDNTILESNKLKYESSCSVVIPEPYLSLWNSGIVYVRLHNTQVHQTRVQDTHNSSLKGSSTSWHFLMPKIQLS